MRRSGIVPSDARLRYCFRQDELDCSVSCLQMESLHLPHQMLRQQHTVLVFSVPQYFAQPSADETYKNVMERNQELSQRESELLKTAIPSPREATEHGCLVSSVSKMPVLAVS